MVSLIHVINLTKIALHLTAWKTIITMPRTPSSFCFNSGIKRMRVSKDIASELFYMFIPILQVLIMT